MKVIAVIQDPVEIRDILAHLVKTARAKRHEMYAGQHTVASYLQPLAASCNCSVELVLGGNFTYL